MAPLEKLLTMQEAAEILGVTRKTLLAHIRQGRIAYINVGVGDVRESRRLRPSDIAAFMQAQRRFDQPATRESIAEKRRRSTVSTPGSREFDMRALLARHAKPADPAPPPAGGIRGLLARQEEKKRKNVSR